MSVVSDQRDGRGSGTGNDADRNHLAVIPGKKHATALQEPNKSMIVGHAWCMQGVRVHVHVCLHLLHKILACPEAGDNADHS